MTARATNERMRVVDVHTHMYTPEYIKILQSRDKIPLVRKFEGSSDPRLILLEAEVQSLEEAEKKKKKNAGSPTQLPGRPLTRHFSSLEQKLHFMDTHGIDVSVISLANPWLDFVGASESGPIARSINEEFNGMCALHPGRLFFFAVLPLTAPVPTVLESIAHVSNLEYCRGVILGTSGLFHSEDSSSSSSGRGRGLDDPDLLPIFKAIAAVKPPTGAAAAEEGLLVFVHPHYGLPNEVWGPRASAEYGHVLPLALGFPMETTIAITRMYLAGVFDEVPDLRLLLAHSGGTLPFLAGRIDSCVRHDGFLQKQQTQTQRQRRKNIWEVLKTQIYLDAVIYSHVGLKAAINASNMDDPRGRGVERLMFGTDHPFFPPLENGEGNDTLADGQWESVTLNMDAVYRAGLEDDDVQRVLGTNASRVMFLEK
ncbi:amidohydrolase [Diplogelasinospora grovesii]|uniref:Amidohydrolase n=1 Tax=Diplogelasinospora grovesii TaxID=303347 RepID=A0AAN6NDW1_9PEZI|nr:amidohydrolase [Diplogelasinospora grovesii]